MVAAVRLGLRRASRAATTRRGLGLNGSTRIVADTARARSVGSRPRIRTATNVTAAAIAVSRTVAPAIVPTAAAATARTAAREVATTIGDQRRDDRGSVSATASIGATPQALRTGRHAAVSVASRPIPAAASAACGVSSGPAVGTAVPMVPSARSISTARSRPSGTPTRAETAASMTASPRAARRSWPLEAPTRRNPANIRRRWAWSSVSELATVTMPTNSASTPKPVTRTRTRVKLRVSDSCACTAAVAPSVTSTPGPAMAPICDITASTSAPSSVLTAIRLSSSGWSSIRRDSSVVITTRLEPSARPAEAESAIPTTSYSPSLANPATRTSSPMSTPATSAVWESTTTSPSELGATPELSTRFDTSGSSGQFMSNGCSESPGAATGTPEASSTVAVPSRRCDTVSTPSTPEASSARAEGTRRRTFSSGDS